MRQVGSALRANVDHFVDLSYVGEENGVEVNAFIAKSTSGELQRYLSVEKVSPCFEAIGENASSIVVIRSIEVPKRHRGCGYGTEALYMMIEEADSREADAVILIADVDEPNEFELEEWYERAGFETVTYVSGEFPFMVRSENPELVNAIRNSLSPRLANSM